MCTFQKISLCRNILRYQKQKFAHKLTGMHLHLFSTCNLQLHLKRDASIYRFKWVLQNFLGTLLLWKSSCGLVLKEEFYETWRTNILIIIKIYREVHSSFKKQTLWGKRYLWEPLIESWQLCDKYFISKVCY